MNERLLDCLNPQERQRMKSRLADPITKQAMAFWVAQALNQLGQVKSEQQIVAYLLEKLAGHGCSVNEAQYIYRVAVNEFNRQQKITQGLVNGANSRKVLN